MTSLTAIITDMLTREDAESIRLNDGATTWDLYNLHEALTHSDDEDASEYVCDETGIFRIGADGYRESVPVYRIETEAADE